MRRAAKADDNQAVIVAAFRAMGCTVQHLHTVGRGVPDLLVFVPGIDGVRQAETCLVEIKDGNKPPSKQRLTPDERAFVDQWRGPVYVVRSIEEAAALFNGELPPFGGRNE